ncbi:MAG TPA: acyl-ACP thioesterase domain-containing protein [Candidatus Limnocylindrales bacterium]
MTTGGPAGSTLEASLDGPFWTSYRVRFDEAGPDGWLRASGLLRYAQDVAWQHSEALGFDRAWYADRGLAWVVRAVDLTRLATIPMGAIVTTSTTVAGYRKVWARRRADIRLPDDTTAATVDTDWVLIDGRGRLTRLPSIFAEVFPAPLATFDIGRVTLPATPPEALRSTLIVRPHEIDPLGHVNNGVYLDWLDEAAALLPPSGRLSEGSPGAQRYRLEYAASAESGDRLESAIWAAGGGVAYRLTRAIDGQDLVRGMMEP